MILNGYAVLDLFVAALRLPLSVLVLGIGCCQWVAASRRSDALDRTKLEIRSNLGLLLATTLLGLNVVSLPLFYALLQSYIPQWPGVMCIYGVTRIGTGSEGFSGYLPLLLRTLQATKPLLVFLSGSWLVVYVLYRRSLSPAMIRPVLVALGLFGAVSAFDTAIEATYLVTPKKETFLDVGCCTSRDATSSGSKLVPRVLMSSRDGAWITVSYYFINAVLATGLVIALKRTSALPGKWWWTIMAGGTIVAVPIGWAYLSEVAAPSILKLPYHHCPYDLVTGAPECLVGVALFASGCFSIGWAGLAAWSFKKVGIRDFVENTVNGMLLNSLCALLGSVLFFLVELALA